MLPRPGMSSRLLGGCRRRGHDTLEPRCARRGLDIAGSHPEKLVPSIPVVRDRRGVDLEHVQRLHVVDPHGQGIMREEEPEGRFALPQRLLGFQTLGHRLRDFPLGRIEFSDPRPSGPGEVLPPPERAGGGGEPPDRSGKAPSEHGGERACQQQEHDATTDDRQPSVLLEQHRHDDRKGQHGDHGGQHQRRQVKTDRPRSRPRHGPSMVQAGSVDIPCNPPAAAAARPDESRADDASHQRASASKRNERATNCRGSETAERRAGHDAAFSGGAAWDTLWRSC